MSCIASIPDHISHLDIVREWVPKDGSWKILNDEEKRIVMQGFRGDCYRFPNPRLDAQDNPINIAIKIGEKLPETRVWSNGLDGISGTDDDVVMPYGREIPK